MSKIPCEDCITLPICIQRYHKFKNVKTFKVMELTSKCEIVKKYVGKKMLVDFQKDYSPHKYKKYLNIVDFFEKYKR